jgi:uncharacterized protein (DUF1800 family)
MKSRFSHLMLRVSAALLLLATASIGIFAQSDPDPNSPTPILLTEATSTRALAQSKRAAGKVNPSRITANAFSSNSKVVLYATNFELMEGEGANAFRVYVIDGIGHQFRFPVLEIKESTFVKRVYEITVLLTDELRFWDSPINGDALVFLAWRGLASNQVRLGLGSIGDGPKDPVGAKPAPLDSVVSKSASKNDQMEPMYVGYRWSGDRTRLLEQAAFGPNPALDTRIRRIGLRAWLAEQFDATYPSLLNPYPNQPLKPANAPADCDGDQTVTPDVPATCYRDTYSMYPTQTWFMREAYYGDAQLKHRVAWALAEMWVTSGNDVQQSRHMVEYHKILSNNAFGNYRNLMGPTAANPTGGMTLNPAMGNYLDMAISTKLNPNENYARELNQLFTVGLFMLNQDGTKQLDGSGNPVPTYDQNVINNFTKVLTGWTFCQTQGASCPNFVQGSINYIDPMLLNTGNHDLTAKTLLNYPGANPADRDIAACAGCTGTAITTYANASLNHAMDNIFNHPSLGPYVSKVLIQHLVTSDPTPAYVSRVAGVFNNNGFGVRGDMKAVVKAILLDPEARGDVKTDPNYGKLREPVQYATNILRMFNVRSADSFGLSDGSFGVVGIGRTNGQVGEFFGMSQIPFLSPTVFNYFPPDYVIPNSSLLGPEFAIMTTGITIQRANFVNRLVFTTPAIAIANPDYPNGTSLDFSDLQALAAADTTGNQLVDELNRRMMHSTMSAQMKSTILTAVLAIASTDPLQRSKQAVYLVATSSQYQVQR